MKELQIVTLSFKDEEEITSKVEEYVNSNECTLEYLTENIHFDKDKQRVFRVHLYIDFGVAERLSLVRTRDEKPFTKHEKAFFDNSKIINIIDQPFFKKIEVEEKNVDHYSEIEYEETVTKQILYVHHIVYYKGGTV